MNDPAAVWHTSVKRKLCHLSKPAPSCHLPVYFTAVVWEERHELLHWEGNVAGLTWFTYFNPAETVILCKRSEHPGSRHGKSAPLPDSNDRCKDWLTLPPHIFHEKIKRNYTSLKYFTLLFHRNKDTVHLTYIEVLAGHVVTLYGVRCTNGINGTCIILSNAFKNFCVPGAVLCSFKTLYFFHT